jgi:hypothetical protein
MPHPTAIPLSRRELLRRCGMGLGALALGDLLAGPADAGVAVYPLAPKRPPLPAKAKHVIHLFMNGGPSHVDTFDPKPSLAKYAGKALPTENLRTERKTGAAFPSPYKFEKYGKSGIEVSEIFPHVAKCVDDLCVIRSMHGDVPNHEPSLMLWTWLTYGLGTENQNLPGFIVMCPGGYPIQESQNWQAGFLPGAYQGTYLDTRHTDLDQLIEHVRSHTTSAKEQRRQLNLLLQLNERHRRERAEDAQLDARIQSFELAFRMQTEAAEVFDVNREPQYVRDLYGPGVLARTILTARRLIERGVRVVQVWHGAGQPWDNHDDLEVNHRRLAKECDQAIGALLVDLKQRGLLDETVVLWGGEFGRTPTVELPTPGANAGKINGRDHNHHGFTVWLAGGGVKGGQVIGATDEFGFRAVDNKVHVHDLHATLLRLLGFDHETFTFRHAGRDFRLTDVHGRVVQEVLA